MNETSKLEPWQWPETHWRGLVNQVRAGKNAIAQDLEGRRAMRVCAVVRFRS